MSDTPEGTNPHTSGDSHASGDNREAQRELNKTTWASKNFLQKGWKVMVDQYHAIRGSTLTNLGGMLLGVSTGVAVGCPIFAPLAAVGMGVGAGLGAIGMVDQWSSFMQNARGPERGLWLAAQASVPVVSALTLGAGSGLAATAASISSALGARHRAS